MIADVTNEATHDTFIEYFKLRAELTRSIATLEAERKAINDLVKEYMTLNNMDSLYAGHYHARFYVCTKSFLDADKIRQLYPDVYNDCLKTTEYTKLYVDNLF